DYQTLMRTAVVLLAVTAAGGLVLAGIRFSGRPHPPIAIAMVHGLLAAAGLTLLLYGALARGLPGMAWTGLVLLLVAALGGIVLNLRYHWQRIALPPGIVLGHAGAGAVGLVLVALGVWNA
ncbi:MAG TPA: hypothetical protein VNB23_05940, partial [Ramlibacter sp.]|nr:hypothetical protein [Ramlibacter sp.]